MPKPKTKSELLQAANETYDLLLELIQEFTAEEQQGEFPFPHRDRCIRDVVGHVLEWQRMFHRWHQDGQRGIRPEMPAPGFSWRQTPALNQQIQQQYQSLALFSLLHDLGQSHLETLALIKHYNETELFEKKHVEWTGSSSLAAYLVSATSAHYHWAIKLLKKYRRALAANKLANE